MYRRYHPCLDYALPCSLSVELVFNMPSSSNLAQPSVTRAFEIHPFCNRIPGSFFHAFLVNTLVQHQTLDVIECFYHPQLLSGYGPFG